ncbi:MAG: phosphoadenosine phosphosulfate reductase family protein [Anaerolineae bacterium]|nr:phosphoadenosine phosphosulfate reductase family protein [Anaerolineae bacterium]
MSYQLPLFPLDAPPNHDPVQLLRDGATLVLSVSGGKDSDAMSHHLLERRQTEGWSGDIVMIHADLGARVEWQQTPDYVQNLARRKGVPLYVVRWTHGDLIDRIWQRYYKDPSRPCWPSAQMRYCTADLKRGPISREIRHLFPSGNVICAMGLRAQESQTRARRSTFALRADTSAPTKGRFVYDWLPIHDWTETDVWDCIRRHGDVYHEAYSLGNHRLSCALCVLASLNDLINGAVHNRATYREYCQIEAVTGYSFRQDFWLSDLKPDLLPESTLIAVRDHKRKIA